MLEFSVSSRAKIISDSALSLDAKMKYLFVCLITVCAVHAQRRTAPRRTTQSGGTYGTETFPTTPEPVTATIASAAAPRAAAGPAPPQMVGFGAGAASIAGFPSASLPAMPAGLSGPPLPPGFPAAGLNLPGVPFGAPLAPGILGIPGAIQVPVKPAGQGPSLPVTTTEEPNDERNTGPVDTTPVLALCEEVEEILPPGTTQQECFTGEPIQLRYWQPYRALRNIKCKYDGNHTIAPDNYKDICAASYNGASCMQRYQQFVVLAAMGPAASGWSCIRLGSGCSCSVRNKKRLRITDYEQRTDLHEFMKS